MGFVINSIMSGIRYPSHSRITITPTIRFTLLRPTCGNASQASSAQLPSFLSFCLNKVVIIQVRYTLKDFLLDDIWLNWFYYPLNTLAAVTVGRLMPSPLIENYRQYREISQRNCPPMKMMIFLATPVLGSMLRAFSSSASAFDFQNSSSSSPICSLGCGAPGGGLLS